MSANGAGDRAELMGVYRQWWSHDAHWYQGVAARFGQKVANEINAEAIRRVAVQVGQRVAKQSGAVTADDDIEALRRRYEMCAERMFPSELRSGGLQVLDDDLIELTLRKNFAITMLRMAGSLDGYECPCVDIHAGWSEGLGVTLSENRATGCLRRGDRACRLLMRVGTAAGAAEPSPIDEAVDAGVPGGRG